MRLLRVLLLAVFAAIALVAGLFVALLVAGTTAAIALGAKFVPRNRRRASMARPPRRAPDDAIDVTATEVRGETLLKE